MTFHVFLFKCKFEKINYVFLISSQIFELKFMQKSLFLQTLTDILEKKISNINSNSLIKQSVTIKMFLSNYKIKNFQTSHRTVKIYKFYS